MNWDIYKIIIFKEKEISNVSSNSRTMLLSLTNGINPLFCYYDRTISLEEGKTQIETPPLVQHVAN